MKDSSRFLLLYIDMLRRCKDNEIADFLMNTAYFSEDNKNIEVLINNTDLGVGSEIKED